MYNYHRFSYHIYPVNIDEYEVRISDGYMFLHLYLSKTFQSFEDAIDFIIDFKNTHKEFDYGGEER